jgi:hypothetical protein
MHMITVSSEHIFNGASRHLPKVYNVAWHSLLGAFFSPGLGTDTHECAGELPLILAPMEIWDAPSGPACLSGFGN